jgi:WD40 repeat protein
MVFCKFLKIQKRVFCGGSLTARKKNNRNVSELFFVILRTWSVTDGSLVCDYGRVTGDVLAGRFSHDGSFIAVATKNLLLFNTSNGMILQNIDSPHGSAGVRSLDVTKSGQYVVTKICFF